jgi:phospholipase/carboxylesterase
VRRPGGLARVAAGGFVAGLIALASVSVAVSVATADELRRDEASGLEYLQVVTGGAGENDPLAIVVAMHGLGDHPESFRLLLDDLPARARVVFPRGPMPHGEDGFSWFNFHADDAEGDGELVGGMKESSERVAKLIRNLVKKYGGPPRAVVCGFSQGGMLSFALAASHPDLIAEAIPVSGYLPQPLWPLERPKSRPLPTVLALHGEADRLIPVEKARWSVEALRGNGFSAELRTWPGVPHALSPPIRATLIASVVSAIERIAPSPAAAAPAPSPAPAPDGSAPAPGESAPGEPVPRVPEMVIPPDANDAAPGSSAP